MAAYGRPTLRDLFDESPTPHIAHPPRSHHRDFYIATDGSFRPHSGGPVNGDRTPTEPGGLGVVIETLDGEMIDAPQVRQAEWVLARAGSGPN